MRMKRFLASLLALLMLFSLMQIAALAEDEEEAGQISLVETDPEAEPEEAPEIVPEADEPEALPVEDDPAADPVAYDLWVCGVQVTDSNKNMIKSGVRFDPATATLTIQGNVGSTFNNPELYNDAVIYSELPELIITTGATFSFTSDSAEKLIYVNGGNLTLTKTSTAAFTISSASASYGVYVADGDLTINCDLTVDAASAEYGIYIDNGDLLVDKTVNRASKVTFENVKNGVGIKNGTITGSSIGPTLTGPSVENAIVVSDSDLFLAGKLWIRSSSAQYGIYVPAGTVTNTANLDVSLSGNIADSCIYAEKGFSSSGALSVSCYDCDGGYGIKVMDGDVVINGEVTNIGAWHTGIYCGSGDVTITGVTGFEIFQNEEDELSVSSGIYTADGSITMGAFSLFGGANWVLYANGPIHITEAIDIGNEGDFWGGNGIKSTRGGIVIDGNAAIEAINCIVSEGEEGILINGDATIKANGRYGISAANGPITVAGSLDVRGAGYTAVTAKGDITVGGNVYASASTPSQFPEFPGNAMESTDGSINVTGNLSCDATKNPLYAKNDIHVGGNALTSAAVANDSAAGDFGIKAETGAVTIGGTLTCEGKADISVYGGESITVNAGATVINTAEDSVGMVSDGTVTFVAGTWDVNATAAAIQAAEGIEIAEGYGVTLPKRGKVALLDGAYTVTEADGTTVAAHAIISEVLPPVTVLGKSLSLEGKISLNFYLDIPASVLALPGAYAEISGERFPLSEAEYLPVRGESGYRFTVKVKFAQLTEERILRVFDGNDEPIQLVDLEGNDLTETGLVYRAQDYIEAVRANPMSDELLAVVDALSDLGSLAQAQFNYNVDSRVEVVNELSAVTAETVEAYKLNLNAAEGSPVRYFGSSLLLKDITTLRHYFKVQGDVSNYSFTVDGVEVTPVYKDSFYYIDITEIAARDLDKSFHVEVSNADGVLVSLDYSAMSYVFQELSFGNSPVLTDLARAVALYSAAANVYFPD